MLTRNTRMALSRGLISFNISSSMNSKDLRVSNWVKTEAAVVRSNFSAPARLSHQYVSDKDVTKKNQLKGNKSSPAVLYEFEDEQENSINLSENDFEEKFIKGSGPGGQKINKTNSCVELKHKETGIVLKCQETRSLERNRVIARNRLAERLRQLFAPGESRDTQQAEKKRKRDQQKAYKRRLKEQAVENRKDV